MKKETKSTFPVVDDQGRGLVCADEGMTLRDWFAGQALGALISDVERYESEAAAQLAYRFADAMMKARDAG